jgi:uncharacterized protein YyaL (SSP411 family)
MRVEPEATKAHADRGGEVRIMANRLASETSPYLLQHQNNPVDWYPWGPEALERARREDKPIFLSIGYSACHWCHVMEHESFENPDIAKELNAHFVCIKVDREERPDIDQIYMNAVQMMTGRGGWPMSVFLTPDLQPFFGGTYWPPEPRHGMHGFYQVVRAVVDAWQNRRSMAVEQAAELTTHLRLIGNEPASGAGLSRELLERSVDYFQRKFDSRNGGFGGAPKFPHAMDLRLLLRLWRRQPNQVVLDMVTTTLDKMAAGGIYDHLAGGFARYSVDERWLVPHFEKMLYDNALLTRAYLETYLATGKPAYASVVRETCDYVLKYMTDPQGGFHSAEDADSEGVEGKFYVWKPDEIVEALGPEKAERFSYVYDVTPQGNFEHEQSILNLPRSIEEVCELRGWDGEQLEAELKESRAILLARRDKRVRPGKDDKVLVSWNALMIDALAAAAGALDEPRYLAAATKAADFLLSACRRADGRLLHSWRSGQAKFDAYLDDYAYFGNALVTLYEATFREEYLDHAVALAETLLDHFQDVERGGFYFTADDHEQLIARNKDLHDSSVPSGNSMAATALLRLAKLTGSERFLQAAERTLQAATGVMEKAPAAAGQMLIALDFLLGPTPEIVVLGDAGDANTEAALKDLRKRFLPNYVLAARAANGEGSSKHLDRLFEGRQPLTPSPTVYVCENYACQAPVNGVEGAIAQWQTLERNR